MSLVRHNTIKTAALLGLLSGVLLLAGSALGGQQGLLVAFAFAAVMNFGSYWFSDKLTLAMYRAQLVGPEHRLRRLVERVARRASLPMPRVYVLPTEAPNAFATTWPHARCRSRRIPPRRICSLSIRSQRGG